MSKPALFRTSDTFESAAEAVAFFNTNRAEGVDPIPQEVLDFLVFVSEYDPEVQFNVQPSFRTFYIAAANPDDHHAWLYAKPQGVTFLLGDERNVEAVHDMWGPPQDAPPRILPTDVWFTTDELFNDAEVATPVDMCLRLAAAWAPMH